MNLREVTSGFGMLGLLFVEVSGEGDDVGVDLLIANGAALSISRHDCDCMKSLGVVKAGGKFSWGKKVVGCKERARPMLAITLQEVLTASW